MSIGTFAKKRLLALKYSFAGIRYLLKTEAHAQLQFFIAVLVIIAGIYFDISRMEWMMQLFCIALVLCTETLNTAIEKLADFVHPQFHHKIGRIKDIAAGAVSFAALATLIIGILIYWPYVKIYLETSN